MRILLVGDPEVGKTSLIRKLSGRPVLEEYIPTDFYAISVATDDLEIIDFPGKDLERSFASHAFTDVDRIVVMLAVDDVDTLHYLHRWIERFQHLHKPITIVANKSEQLPFPVPTKRFPELQDCRFISVYNDSKERLLDALK